MYFAYEILKSSSGNELFADCLSRIALLWQYLWYLYYVVLMTFTFVFIPCNLASNLILVNLLHCIVLKMTNWSYFLDRMARIPHVIYRKSVDPFI
jgi:hypothetical protein